MFAVRPVIWHFLWWVLLAPLLLLELNALHALQDLLALHDSSRGRSAVAMVTDYQENTTTALIRYRFQVPGDATWYSATDMFGRRDLWTPLASQVAQRARREKQISVTYLPENPWANQPAGRGGNPVADSFAGWIMFLLIDLLWLGETFIIGRNFLRCLLAAERQQLTTMRFWRTIRT